jgi:hypothetical protein
MNLLSNEITIFPQNNILDLNNNKFKKTFLTKNHAHVHYYSLLIKKNHLTVS